MPVIIIREEQATESGFNALLMINNQEYSITVSDPFEPREENLLEWYFEGWLVTPMLNTETAKKAADSVNHYGLSLFEQVFKSDINAYANYCQLRGHLKDIQFEIKGKTPEFQSLHWEAMKDPELSRPFAVDCLMTRRLVKPINLNINLPVFPVINLLAVVARPDEDSDIGYRTIARPLVELIDQGNLRVNIEILRPGTYESLCKHLEAKGSNYYHIIHFDLHGGLMTYQEFQKGVEKNRYLYQRGYGLEQLEPYNGVKAFLFFEGENKGKAVPVEASELTSLLTGKNIPVCILNACQSGKQIRLDKIEERDDNKVIVGKGVPLQHSNETSLSSRLMQAEMQMVVGMAYSVTVSAARLMMQALYKELFNSKPITEAIRLSRLELYNNKGRQAYFNEIIDLEDWLLPVVYNNQPVNFNLREMTPEETEEYYTQLEQDYRFPLPVYGFVGRDLEILKIEKSLLKHNVLLLQGMGGTGKTTLLNYLREWWYRTHYANKIFYFGYDTKAWTVDQILFEVGRGIYNRFEFAKFQPMGDAAKLGKLITDLRSSNHILILDNLESVTGQPLAIQNTLEKTEQEKLKYLLQRLKGGKTKIVLGSRSEESWLKEVYTNNNIRYLYPLQGLDKESRTELAEKILEATIPNPKKRDKVKEDDNFKRLMKLLAGYPLAMEVVLGNLKTQTPQEILNGLQLADVNLDTGSENKTESILKCVEYSHSNLSPDAQKLLLCLAPFSSFINRFSIPNYVQELQKLDPFQDYPFDQFEDAISEAIHWGLLSPMLLGDPPQPDEDLLTIQPVFPYFLKTKVKELDTATQEALQEGFKNHYIGLARSYFNLLQSKEPQKRQIGIFYCRLEYENLFTGLQICLEKQETIDIYQCLTTYLEVINDYQSCLKLDELVCNAVQNYSPAAKETQLGLDIVIPFVQKANNYLQLQQYEAAKDAYLQSIELLNTLNKVDEQQKQSKLAAIYHQLGIVAQELREWEEARNYYQQAIEYSDRYSQASTYHQLGIVAQELREWEEARNYYQQALSIKIEYSDSYSQASTYQLLGVLAQELHEWEEARKYYKKALCIFIKYSDHYSQAGICHNLGVLAQKLCQWEQAQTYYEQALSIKIEYSDRYSQARTYYCLGMVAEATGNPEDAKNYYLQALQIWVEFNDQYWVENSIQNFKRFYQDNPDDSILEGVASIFNTTVEEIRSVFNN
ncbi:Tetratricopeptide TPR_2 repeat protein [Rippkaea orientalis PCC 8801]|uniref:Tetratricopeptide TPR_2 repeat protein n=1 Tax=Rippkaea orientalis (strain PCC 8801 / RF-1) TaxID=41431 RepID=B7JUH7_RIPO1|nr:tetratricopeptide repeat protein [Rippkaea orientalis]ACK64557.1 Tetratricopeptide TPR_2 repeat protein [Rippkaea orientalis PCC 8801]